MRPLRGGYPADMDNQNQHDENPAETQPATPTGEAPEGTYERQVDEEREQKSAGKDRSDEEKSGGSPSGSSAADDKDDRVEEWGEESFPASDPPSNY